VSVRPSSRIALARLLIYAYPPRFRRQFGDAMRADVADRLADPLASSWRVMLDLSASAIREWFAPTLQDPLTRATAGGDTPARSHLLDDLRLDLRVAWRGLVRRPGLSIAILTILALGIGANTAIFSVVNVVLVRPLPFGDPSRLVAVWEHHVEEGSFADKTAPASFFAWRDRVRSFKNVAAYGGGVVTIADGTAAESVPAASVSGNFFDVIGVPAEYGRTFHDDETWSDTTAVVMLSDGLWARRFGRNPAIVGSTITVNEESSLVVGIVPPGCEFPENGVDVWLTFRWDRASQRANWFRTEHFLQVVARLADGATLERARAELLAVEDRIATDTPEAGKPAQAGITPLQLFLAGDAERPLQVLLGSTMTLLLLACANVANLLLVRATGRRREVAVRSALGARRGRLVRQMITESLLLASVGGALGIGAGTLGARALLALQSPGALARVDEAWRQRSSLVDAPLDARVLIFAVAITLATGVIFGLVPALRAAAAGGTAALRDGTRTSAGGAHRRMTRLLVVAELALAVVLVVGAGLLLRSFVALRGVDPGIQTDHRVAASIALPKRYNKDGQVLNVVDQIATSFNRLPGVTATTYASRLPLGGTVANPTPMTIEGRRGAVDDGYLGSRAVAANYFEVFGVPVLRGRAFTNDDRLGAEVVIVINQTAARRFFPGDDPVGQRITWDEHPSSASRWYRIVGVVGDEHQHGVREAPQVEGFLPFAQLSTTRISFVVDAPGGDGRLVDGMRRAVTSIDPALPLYQVQTLDEIYAASLGRDRFLLTLVAAFAVLALLLAALGVYGVTAEATSQRTQEIGIRVALGARSSEIAGLILRQGFVVALVGIAVGLGLAAMAARVLAGVLFGVQPLDVITFAVVSSILAIAALAACAIPARRAARLDPLLALRRE
jgi:putative ABC transport system permease protein